MVLSEEADSQPRPLLNKGHRILGSMDSIIKLLQGLTDYQAGFSGWSMVFQSLALVPLPCPPYRHAEGAQSRISWMPLAYS